VHELLRVSVDGGEKTAVVHCAGEIDLSNAAQLRDAIAGAITADDVDVLRLDLTEVSFIDTSGISVIFDAASGCHGAGRKMAVDASAIVLRTLTMIGFGVLVERFGGSLRGPPADTPLFAEADPAPG
jgi:anti-sigma B factor antagonist